MSQGASRGEVREGAADHCVQSRRPQRSQVKATTSMPFPARTPIWHSSCACMTVDMTNSSRAKDKLRMQRPLELSEVLTCSSAPLR